MASEKPLRRLLVAGNDKLSGKLIAQLEENQQLRIILEKSTDLKRTWQLYRKRRLKLIWLLKMKLAELAREKYHIPTFYHITNNDELFHFIRQYRIERVYLFRAGLIISKKILELGVDILNTHCARIPDYGGLGAIPRALRDGAFDQVATLHRITQKIDEGKIIETEPYQLNPGLSYRRNEDIAYHAGIRLLVKQFPNNLIQMKR
jgi:methionyl-tRNA formyltransferase